MTHTVTCLDERAPLADRDELGDPLDLVELLSRNMNLVCARDLFDAAAAEIQGGPVCGFCGAAAARSQETAHHVRRVAEMSELIALEYGLPARDAALLKQASRLHDVGKMGIPDAVLNKAGPHTAEEAELMKTHAVIGYVLLRDADQEILRLGSIVARDHHEKWDGTGYPYGKAGAEISVEGRITAAVDVFDALCSRRCYKDAWAIERVVELFQAERGRHFEPAIVDLVLENLDALQAIRARLPDDD